ncbi:uncharacterized protein TA05315 [Theileria annulata]|uniref:Uncharacterized protein n=1 Tax=Theileria annulata TaxID=5874 RepID=Q4UCU1_THEAN|nr:uncharacterized protein TA05315 [Theileria annulata]CAI75360.1 hypothetical protein TA05315 [Theileria annulata]|eukprot:XP_954836.1 hypothetical protein TA05315 [Theileria annulata]
MKLISIIVLLSTVLVKVNCGGAHLNPNVFKGVCTELTARLQVLMSNAETQVGKMVMNEDFMNSLSLFKEKLGDCVTACESIENVLLPPGLENEIFIEEAKLRVHGLTTKIDFEINDKKIYNFIDKGFEAVVELVGITKHLLITYIASGDFSTIEGYYRAFIPKQDGFKMNMTIISFSIPLILVMSNALLG